tara:strand:- start:4302 stop:5042 length:741 start_codon:yes stop_codon:yes gene_type:complete
MLPLFLLGCQPQDPKHSSKNKSHSPEHEEIFLDEKKELKQFEKHALKFKVHTVKTESLSVAIPVHKKIQNIKVNFHMMDHTVPEDIDHVILASTQILEDVIPATYKKLGIAPPQDLRACFDNIDQIELYHTKCQTMNSDKMRKDLDESYPVKGGSVVAGQTQSDRSTRTFTVSYCYDDMLKASTKISYEEDKHYREVTLAHEMVHVWLAACKPGAKFIFAREFELAAWEFHQGYEATAKKLHIDYR